MKFSILLSLLLGFSGVAFARPGPLELLSAITVREISFENATVEEVVASLVAASREADPDGIGVNMIFLTTAGEEEKELPRISLDLRGVTLRRVLDLVMERTGLSYRVEHNIVRIARRGNDRLETRFYPVDSSLIFQRAESLQRN